MRSTEISNQEILGDNLGKEGITREQRTKPNIFPARNINVQPRKQLS